MIWDALKSAKSSKSSVAAVWLDVANGYSSIPHTLIFFALQCYGVPEKWIRLVRTYYSGLWSKSFSPNAFPSWHQHEKGIFIGCI